MHDLYDDPEVRAAVIGRWGEEVAPAGSVDRRRVAARAFASGADREWLERLLWPRVGARIAAWRERQARRSPPPRALVVEVPLLFESGLDATFDTTIAIVADEDVRAARAGARGHAAVDERTARQLPQDEKARRATYAVGNSGTLAELEQELSGVLANLSR